MTFQFGRAMSEFSVYPPMQPTDRERLVASRAERLIDRCAGRSIVVCFIGVLVANWRLNKAERRYLHLVTLALTDINNIANDSR